jgi:CBS domain-containing protein
MFIKNIISTKGKQPVHVLSSKETVQSAVSILSSNRIGVIVVSDNGKTVDGILSERDIVRELGARGALVLHDSVDNLMTKDVKTCSADDSAQDVLQTMTDGRFRHIPVVNDTGLVAMISIGDLVKARLDAIEHENNAIVEMIRG